MQKIRLAYFGSPSFSADLLEKIILDTSLPIEVVLVVTQPDKPAGRKQVVTPSPVKIVAQKYCIEILQDSGIFSTCVGKELDLALVYAYGEILPKEILSLPEFGFWNIHPSLLPLYRGASPIAYPLIFGDKETGVSLMLMDDKMDHGPLFTQEKMEISPNDTRTDLEIKLTNLANKQLKQLLAKNADFLPGHLCTNKRAMPSNSFTLARDKKYAFELTPQNHSQATYTKKLSKSDGFIPFVTLKKMLNNEKITPEELPSFVQIYLQKYTNKNKSSEIADSLTILFNLFRGLSPWPGIWTLLRSDFIKTSEKQALLTHEMRLKITEIKLVNNIPTITIVQLEGKKEVDFATFNKAYQVI